VLINAFWIVFVSSVSNFKINIVIIFLLKHKTRTLSQLFKVFQAKF